MMMLLTLLATLAYAGKGPPPAIDAVLQDFVQGAATRDLKRVSRALHPEARQYVAMPDGLQVIETDAYLELLKAEKIGGTATTSTLHEFDVSGHHAIVRQTRDVGAFRLNDLVTLVEEDGAWRIVAVSVVVAK